MKAVVSVTFNDCLAVHDIKVIYARDRYFIVMPSRKNPDGTYRDIVHPINSDFRAALEEAVIDAYHVQLVAAEHDEREADDTYVIWLKYQAVLLYIKEPHLVNLGGLFFLFVSVYLRGSVTVSFKDTELTAQNILKAKDKHATP